MVVPNCLAYKCQLNTYCMHSPTPTPPLCYIVIIGHTPIFFVLLFGQTPPCPRLCNLWTVPIRFDKKVLRDSFLSGVWSLNRWLLRQWGQLGPDCPFVASSWNHPSRALPPPGPPWLHRQRAQSLRPWERTGLPPIYLLPPCVLSPNCDGHVRKYWLDLSIEPKYTLQNIATYSFYLTQVQSLH